MQENPEAGGYGFDDGYLSIFTEEENRCLDADSGKYHCGYGNIGSAGDGRIVD